MSNTTEKIFNLKEQIQRFAATKDHNHDSTYIKIENEDGTITYAPFEHSWSDDDGINHGTAQQDRYGHVKKTLNVTTNQDSVPSNSAVNTFVTSSITNLHNEINQEYDGESGKIHDFVSEYNIESKLKRHSIAIPYQKPNNYTVDEQYGALEQKIQDDKGVDYYTFAGHYLLQPTEENYEIFKIQYHKNLYKYYINGLLDVRRAGDIIIQELYTTEKNSNNEYILSGEKYSRTGIKNGNTVTWNKWIAVIIPYSESAITINIEETGINNMTLKETTAGYIIEWENQGSYRLTGDSNHAVTIATFSTELHTNTTHTFASYLGGYEIIITKNNIKIISNKPIGAVIENNYLKQTYFIPRAG